MIEKFAKFMVMDSGLDIFNRRRVEKNVQYLTEFKELVEEEVSTKFKSEIDRLRQELSKINSNKL